MATKLKAEAWLTGRLFREIVKETLLASCRVRPIALAGTRTAQLVRTVYSFPALDGGVSTTDHIDGCTPGSAARSAPINFSGLINNLVGTGQDRRRDLKVERSRGIEIDD